jgi:chromosome segregation and condensation protein ScpB
MWKEQPARKVAESRQELTQAAFATVAVVSIHQPLSLLEFLLGLTVSQVGTTRQSVCS